MAATRHQICLCPISETLKTSFMVFATGAPVAPDSTPTASFYTDANLAGQSTAMGVSVTVTAFTGKTGMYQVSAAITTGNGFASGSRYHCVISYQISSTQYYHTIEVYVT